MLVFRRLVDEDYGTDWFLCIEPSDTVDCIRYSESYRRMSLIDWKDVYYEIRGSEIVDDIPSGFKSAIFKALLDNKTDFEYFYPKFFYFVVRSK